MPIIYSMFLFVLIMNRFLISTAALWQSIAKKEKVIILSLSHNADKINFSESETPSGYPIALPGSVFTQSLYEAVSLRSYYCL